MAASPGQEKRATKARAARSRPIVALIMSLLVWLFSINFKTGVLPIILTTSCLYFNGLRGKKQERAEGPWEVEGEKIYRRDAESAEIAQRK
jgi:hypothetical protein